MGEAERRERLYHGDNFIFSPTPASLAMVALGQDMLWTAFGGRDPRTIHEHLTREQVSDVLLKVKPDFIHHPRCTELIPQLLRETGCDLDETYFDVPRMRSAYPEHFLTTGIAYAFPPHRDTWFSAPQCQINWWIPMHEITPDDAMAIYPHLFDTPVANNSEVYNYYEWNAKRGEAAKNVQSRQLVSPTIPAEVTVPGMRYLPRTGGILMFSAAQLHETVPNRTGKCRYSIDFRSVHIDDARSKRGRPGQFTLHRLGDPRLSQRLRPDPSTAGGRNRSLQRRHRTRRRADPQQLPSAADADDRIRIRNDRRLEIVNQEPDRLRGGKGLVSPSWSGCQIAGVAGGAMAWCLPDPVACTR